MPKARTPMSPAAINRMHRVKSVASTPHIPLKNFLMLSPLISTGCRIGVFYHLTMFPPQRQALSLSSYPFRSSFSSFSSARFSMRET